VVVAIYYLHDEGDEGEDEDVTAGVVLAPLLEQVY